MKLTRTELEALADHEAREMLMLNDRHKAFEMLDAGDMCGTTATAEFKLLRNLLDSPLDHFELSQHPRTTALRALYVELVDASTELRQFRHAESSNSARTCPLMGAEGALENVLFWLARASETESR